MAATAVALGWVVAGTGADARDRPADGFDRSRAAAERDCAPAGPAQVERLPIGSVSLRRVGAAEAPTWAAFRPGSPKDGAVAEREGRVVAIEDGTITDDVLLDLRADTMTEGDGGLLSLAYDPDDRWLYTYRANEARDDVLTAFPLDPDGLPDGTRGRDLLVVDHPDSLQHHGGALHVAPDGLLYLGLGDGGGRGDPRDNGQDRSTLLGKVLRIDPTPADPTPYRIPPDNPFVAEHGTAPEIWLIGLRNPFRMGRDELTGDLWLGDVGQSCWEEIDRLPTGTGVAGGAGGANLGWDHTEGRHPFEGGEVPGRELLPSLERGHADGWCGVVAGYVPRTPAVPVLEGHLVHTDYCKGQIHALPVDRSGRSLTVDTGLRVESPSAIVPGPAGRPWVLSLKGDVWEIEPRAQ